MSGNYLEELDERTYQRLSALRFEVRRDPSKSHLGKAAFLAQTRQIAIQPVSIQLVERLNEWIRTLTDPFRRKEPNRMFATLSTIFVALTLLFGGTGVTVFAAQNSLPDDFLYPIKTTSEQAQWALLTRTQARLELQLRLSDRRIDEILALVNQKSPIPSETVIRLNEHYNLALRAASELDESARRRALQQISQRLRTHEQLLESVLDAPSLMRIREMLRWQLHLVGEGQDDPGMIQQGQGAGGEPGEGNPGGTQSTGGYGPGPGDGECEDCIPAQDGSGPGPGPQYSAGTGETGAGYGPGPESPPPCDDCTPAMDGTGPGPGPQNQEGSGQPGGDDGGGGQDSSGTPAGGSNSGGGSVRP